MKITTFGKKLIAFLAVFALLLGLTGCLDENDDKTVTLKEAQENVDAVLSKIIFDPTTRENVTSSFPLASKNSGYKDVVIEWSSSEEDIIAIEKNEEKGELTAKVTRPSTTDSRIPEGKDYVVVTLTVVAYQDAGTQRATGKKTIEFRVIAVDSQEATIANIKKAVLASMQERGVALSSNDKDAKVYYETYARILMHVPGKSMIVSDGTQSIVVFGTFDETKYPVNTLVKVKGDVYSYYGNIEFGSNVEVEILPETDSHANIKVCQYVDTEIEAYTTALTAGINNNDEKKIVDIEKLLNFSGATYRVYAKVVKAEAAPGDVYALEDPTTGTRVSIYKYTTNGEAQTAIMEKFVGKYVNINVVTFDRYSTNNCYRVVWDGSEPTEAGAPELTDQQKAELILSNIKVNAAVVEDFELPTIENVVWSLKAESAAAKLEGNKVTVTRGVEDVEVVFVATATVGTATETKEFTVVVKKSDVNPSGKSWQVVTELQTGVAYKLGLFQAGITKNLYFKGAMSGYYFATVEEAEAGVDVFLEKVEEGYRMYFLLDGVKQYIEVIISGTHINVVFTPTPTTYFVYNEEYNTMTITLTDSRVCYLGTYGTFNTISASTIDKITSSTSYVSHLYEYKEATPSKVIVDENSSKNASVTEITPESGFDGTTFTFKVTVEEGYELVAVKVNGEVVKAENGVYTSKISGNTKILVETKKVGEKQETVVATTTFSADNNSGPISSYTDTWKVTCDGLVWSVENFNNNKNGWDYVRAGSKKFASVAALSTDAAMADAITKVVVTLNKADASKVNSFKLIVASDADFTNVVEEVELTIAAGENTFALTNPTANCYYKLVIDCKQGTANGFVELAKVQYFAVK
mgnify:FL=1